MNGAEETEALKVLSEQSGFPGIDLNQICIRLNDLAVLPRESAEQYLALPVLVKGERLFVAMAKPSEKRILNELEFATNKRVFPYIALPSTLQKVIADAYDLQEQGRSHYVGSRCPAETMRKAGVLRRPPPPRKMRATGSMPLPPRPDRSPPTPPLSSDSADGSLSEEALHPSTDARGLPPVVILDDNMQARVDSSGESDELIDFAEPLLEDSSPAPASQESEIVPARTADQRTVLVVDDEPDVRRMMVRLLSNRGYRVLEAGNGEAALRIVRDHEPDLVVLDAMLPKVHGFEIARRLKSSDRYQHIPIVMVSAVYRGWRFAQDIKANYHVEEFIEKPFKMDELLAAVEAGLSGSAARTPAVEPNTDNMSAEAKRHLMAGIAAYKAGRIDEAVEHLREGVLVDPLAFRVHFQLGLLLGKAGQLYDAIQELETALSIRSDFFPALKNLAVLYQNAGFRHKAIEMWERCLTAAPDDATRETIKRHLVAVL